MKIQLKFLSLPLLILVFICCTGKNPGVTQTSEKWSVRMAKSTIARWDTLTKFRDVWTYDAAFLARAIYEVSDVEKNQEFYNYFKTYMDYFISDSGTIAKYNPEEFNIDRVQPARNLLILYQKEGDEKYRNALFPFVEQMKKHPRTNEGGYWHKKVYPYQMWLDGLYMAQPFLTGYAYLIGDTIWFSEAVKQITMVYKRTLDPKTGLLYHAYDESRQQRWCTPETGQSKHFWSRAMGWYLMAIVDVLDNLPKDQPGRDSIINILQDVSAALVKVQDQKTGLWYQVLDMGGREGNYLEASGSAMFVYAFAKGVRKGYLHPEYKNYAVKGYEGLLSNLIEIDDKGLVNLNFVCGGCGLGGNPYRDGSYEYYIHEKIVRNDEKGVAPFILASLELDR
jgi:unsaturated rhamnogalacturonyl hydrolase